MGSSSSTDRGPEDEDPRPGCSCRRTDRRVRNIAEDVGATARAITSVVRGIYVADTQGAPTRKFLEGAAQHLSEFVSSLTGLF